MVRKVNFPDGQNTTTVTFDGLSGNDIYLVKVNASNEAVNAADTGNALVPSPNLRQGGITPSFTSSLEELPFMDYHGADELNATPLPFIGVSGSKVNPAQTAVAYKAGDSKLFWLYVRYGYYFVQKEAVLLAQGEHGNVWVIDDGIDSSQAKEIADKFDIIYPAVTNIFGYERGGGPDGDGGIDGDTRIQILVCPILVEEGNSSGVVGYFEPVDLYPYEQGNGSNEAEMLYLNASIVKSYPEWIYSTLAHEFQHLIHLNQKWFKWGLSELSWYNEMLSVITEELIAPMIGIPATSTFHPLGQRMPVFNDYYHTLSISEFAPPYSYGMFSAFGSYLLRNYGGVELLRKIISNNKVGIDSITMALDEFYPGLDFEQALARFGEAIVFSGQVPDSVLTFDKAVIETINGITYTLPAFDIWKIKRNGNNYRPMIFPLTQKIMKRHSVSLHSDDTWKNKDGSFSITIEKPTDPNVLLFLMAK